MNNCNVERKTLFSGFDIKPEVPVNNYAERRKRQAFLKSKCRLDTKKLATRKKLKKCLLGLLAFVLIGLAISCSLLIISSFSPGAKKAPYTDYDLVEITIVPGDTAWEIQKELTPNEDIREMLFYGKQLNGKSMGEVLIGESITFLKEKDTESMKGEKTW